MQDKPKPLTKRQRLMRKALKADHPQRVAQARRESFNQGTPQPVWDCIYEIGQVNYNLSLAFLRSKWKKDARVKKRIYGCLTSQNCVFLTLTFRDDVLAQTDEQTRRRFVRRCLKEQCPSYVANIDFGNGGDKREYIDNEGEVKESTAREHYHALVVLPEGVKRFDMSKWSYGFTYAEKVIAKDFKKVSKYVTKLTAHALKDHGRKPPMMIYSRD